MSTPSTMMRPVVGASRPAIRPSSVDLPLPDAPVIATTSFAGTTRSSRVKNREGARAARHGFRDAVKLNHETEIWSSKGFSTFQTVSATIAAPSGLGWMPSDWLSAACPATLSSRNGTNSR